MAICKQCRQEKPESDMRSVDIYPALTNTYLVVVDICEDCRREGPPDIDYPPD